MSRRRVLSSVLIDGESLPTEVRLFKRGRNETTKGTFVFDDEAAQRVMAAFAAYGNDLMVDLEHLSLDRKSVNYDSDARGWFQLQVRDGELWAVNIRWTEDGVRRLSQKLQRYISPAFDTDENDRVIEVVNMALTSIPATCETPALVAANRSTRRGNKMTLLQRLQARLASLVALADGVEGEAPKGKGAALKEALAAAKSALDEFEKALGSNDIDKVSEAAPAAQAAVDAFEKALSALTGTQDDAAGEGAQMTRHGDESGAQQAMSRLAAVTGQSTVEGMAREFQRLNRVALEHEAEVKKIAAERKAVEDGERRQLVAQLVVLGRETPATAWEDMGATKPKGILATMPIQELRDRVEAFGGTRFSTPTSAPVGSQSVITQTSRVELSEYQVNRIRATLDREKANNPTRKFLSHEQAVQRFSEISEQQLRGAEQAGKIEQCKTLSRAVQPQHVLTTADGRNLVTLSNPVQPIQQFGASSQRALEEFRLEFNATLVSQPIAWAEELGTVLPGGSLKDTYPLSFYAIKYREKSAQNASATTPQSSDVTVSKKLFSASAMAELIRIVKGDFAYIQQWGQTAAQMARARVNLRNHLVADLLEAGVSTAWIDGANFFSASHKVNPFDPKMKLHGSLTWSNYQSSATPLNPGNLTQEKASMYLIPGPDGEEIGHGPTGMLIPTGLKETARLMLTVQDLILDAKASLNSVSNVMGGGNRNEHFNSGFEHIWAPQLASSAATSNYYLFSREAIGSGLPPWVLAEDATEEVRVWDENSDFYKNGSGFIKTESLVYCNAALLYPHGIRLVKGS